MPVRVPVPVPENKRVSKTGNALGYGLFRNRLVFGHGHAHGHGKFGGENLGPFGFVGSVDDPGLGDVFADIGEGGF